MAVLSDPQIPSIAPDAVIRRICDGRAANCQPARHTHAPGTDIDGTAYVCGYMQFTLR